MTWRLMLAACRTPTCTDGKSAVLFEALDTSDESHVLS